MILTLKNGASEDRVLCLTQELRVQEIEFKQVTLLGMVHIVTSASWSVDQDLLDDYVDIIVRWVKFKTEYQLCTRTFKPENTIIDLGDGIVFGSNKTVMMAGPCAVESEDQAMRTAEFLRKNFDIKVFRAGAFKPRTSPYTFQGMGEEGLKILDKVRNEFGMKIISEVKDDTQLDVVAEVADIVQIGTKSMYLFGLLARCGKINKPILLKRGFMATLREFLQAADFILSNGNINVILCERGIRTFEMQTRFSLDVCGAALVKEMSHLPIVMDPSHAVGLSAQVGLVAQAAAAMEIDGLLVEVHPNPATAKSDREQALSFEQFSQVMRKIRPICEAMGRELI